MSQAASALLCELRARGVLVAADAGRLVYDGPAEVLTDSVLAAMRRMKPALLQLLAATAVRCPRCLAVLPLGQSECAGGCELPAVVSARDYPAPLLWQGTEEAWRAHTPQGEGFANHTGRSNHCRVGEASNGAACSEWGEEPAEDEGALLSPAAALAAEGRLAA